MHKGKYYPYHPIYYATEGWFWPGYVPWKMFFFSIQSPAPPRWDVIPVGYQSVSAPGVTSSNDRIITYEFPGVIGTQFGAIVLEMFMKSYSGVKYCVWHALCYQLAYPPSEAWNFQLFPSTQPNTGNTLWWVTEDPMIPPDGFLMSIELANYAQGGSPY